MFLLESYVNPLDLFRNNIFKKEFLILNQLDFESSLFKNSSLKFEVAKVKGRFPILRFAEVTFQNLGNFWSIIGIYNVTGRFGDTTTLT